MTDQAPPTGVGVRRGRFVDVAPLIPFVVLGMLAARAIRDNSFIWHIRAGAVQVDTVRVLTEDVFSFTRSGQSWRTQSWLAEIGYRYAEELFGGLAWSNWMILIVGSVIIAFVGLAVYRSVRSVIVTSLVMVLAVWLLGPFLQPRPVIFSYLFLAMLVVALQYRPALMWTVVPIIWIWAAVHGSWILGLGLVVLEALRTKERRLFLVGFVAAVATLVTAHGIGTWMIAYDFFEAREAVSMMQEWAPPAIQDIVQVPYLLIVAGVVIAGIREKIRVRDLIVIFPFLVFGLSSRRAVFPATIVLLPWASMCLPTPRPSVATARRSAVIAFGVVIGALVLLPMAVNPLGVLEETRFPSREIVESLDRDRWFHNEATGGYLIYADWPDPLVYIDDRAELYGVSGLTEEATVIAGAYEEPFAAWGITAVIAQPDWPLVDILIGDGWIVRAEDEFFITLVAPGATS